MFTGKFNISLSQIDKGRHCLSLELIIIVLEKLAGPIGQLRSHLIHTFIKTENRLCGAICLGRKLSGCHLLNPFLLQDRKSGLDNRIFGYRFFSCHVIHPFFCITYVIILQYYPHAVNEKNEASCHFRARTQRQLRTACPADCPPLPILFHFYKIFCSVIYCSKSILNCSQASVCSVKYKGHFFPPSS